MVKPAGGYEPQPGDDPWDVVVRNRGVVIHLVTKWRRDFPTLDFDDMVQEGSWHLWRAVRNYDPAKSAFSTYIGNCLHRYFQELAFRERRQGLACVPQGRFPVRVALAPEDLKVSINRSPTREVSQADVDAILNHLPVEERRTVIGACTHGVHNYARRRGWNPLRVSWFLKKARRVLRRKFPDLVDQF